MSPLQLCRRALPSVSTIILLLLLTALSRSAAAQYTGLDPALAQAAREYDQAQTGKGDRAALERLVADDYMLIRGNGTTGDKKLLIGLVVGEGQMTDPYTVEHPFQRIYGDTAILGGWVHLTGLDHGKPFVQNARFADTWTRRNGKWQVSFTSVTLIDKP
jgi:Domain of unknown function (DUF4440)